MTGAEQTLRGINFAAGCRVRRRQFAKQVLEVMALPGREAVRATAGKAAVGMERNTLADWTAQNGPAVATE